MQGWRYRQVAVVQIPGRFSAWSSLIIWPKARTKRMSGAERVFDRVVIGLSMLKPRFRVALGYCPLCNSDAPELDDCPLCDGYHTARGDTFPPPKELRRKWLDEMLDVKRTKRNIKKLVRDSRRRRLAA